MVYEVSKRTFINDKIDVDNTCNMVVTEFKDDKNSKLDDSISFSNCFRGFLEYDLFTNNLLKFQIKIKDMLYQKDFYMIFGLRNNISINFRRTNSSDEIFKDKFELEINRDYNSIINNIDCFKQTILNVTEFDPIKNITITSEIYSQYRIIFRKQDNEIPNYIPEIESKELKYESKFNFYDRLQNFTFKNSKYNDVYMNYNSSDRIICKVCHFKRNYYCFSEFSNIISRRAQEILPDPIPPPEDDPIPNPNNNSTNTTTDKNNTNNTENNTDYNNNTNDDNGSTIDPKPDPKHDENNNNTDNNDSTDKTPDQMDISNSLDIVINPLRNDSELIANYALKEPKDKEKDLQILIDLIKKDENTQADKKDIMQTIITLNNLIAYTNCTTFDNKENCKQNLKETNKVMVEKIAEILDCQKIYKTIFGVENSSEKLLLSALTVYYSTANFAYFDSNSLMKMKNVTCCMLKESPEFLSKISNEKENQLNLKIVGSDYLNVLTSSSSNLISISKSITKGIIKEYSVVDKNNSALKNNETGINEFIFDEYKNGSLVLTEENLGVRKVIEENSVMLMRLILDSNNTNKTNNKAFNSTNSLTVTDSGFDLKTKNFDLHSKKCMFYFYFS